MDGRLNVLQLVNEQNALHIPIRLDNVGMATPVAKADAERNTGVLLSGIIGKGYKGEVEILFDRHDLSVLFAEAGVTAKARTTGVITRDFILEQLNSRYGLYLEALDIEEPTIPLFEELETTHQIEIVVRDHSWNWTGRVVVETTYGNPLLETVVLVRVMPLLDHPTDLKILGKNRRYGYMSTFNFDFTGYKQDLQIDPKTGRWANFSRVLEIGAKAGMPSWNNNYVYDRATSQVADANPKFQRVLIQTYATGGVMGPIYFHYDLDW